MAGGVDDQRRLESAPLQLGLQRAFSIIEGPVGTVFLRHHQALTDAVGHDHLLYAVDPFQRLDHRQPHRPGAVDQRDVIGGGLQVGGDIGANGEGFDHGGMAIADAVRDAVGIARRSAGVVAESPVAVHANYLQLGADVRAANRARVAMPAADDRIDRNAFPDALWIDIAPHLVNDAKKLMPDDARVASERVMAMVDMHI